MSMLSRRFLRSIFPKPKSFLRLNHMSKHFTHAIVHTLFAGLIAGAAIAPSNALAEARDRHPFAGSAHGAEPKVLGKTIGEWSVKWWQWAFAIPASKNPMLGGDCEQGQQGPVWFLAGVWDGKGERVKRSCNVPRGKYILFSIANAFWIQLPTRIPPEYTETDYRRDANDSLPPSIGGELEATLDGNPIIFNPKTPIIRSQSPVFTASFPPDQIVDDKGNVTYDNVFGLDPNTLTGDPIVSDGFWVMLPPLSPGKPYIAFPGGPRRSSAGCYISFDGWKP